MGGGYRCTAYQQFTSWWLGLALREYKFSCDEGTIQEYVHTNSYLHNLYIFNHQTYFHQAYTFFLEIQIYCLASILKLLLELAWTECKSSSPKKI